MNPKRRWNVSRCLMEKVCVRRDLQTRRLGNFIVPWRPVPLLRPIVTAITAVMMIVSIPRRERNNLRIGDGLTSNIAVVSNRGFALQDKIEVLDERLGLIRCELHLGRLNVDNITCSPDTLCVLDTQVLIDDDVSVVIKEVLGDVLGIGDHAHGW